MYPFCRLKTSWSSPNFSEPMNSHKLSGIYQEEVSGPHVSPLLQLNEYSLFVLMVEATSPWDCSTLNEFLEARESWAFSMFHKIWSRVKNGLWTDTWRFIAALFTIGPKWKQPECPSMDEWINKIKAEKGVKYWHMLQHGGTLRTLC